MTGITFEAPSGLFFTKSGAGFDGQTNQAMTLSTYADPNRVTDMKGEVIVIGRIAIRGTNEDLRALAVRGFPDYPAATALPGGGLLLDGSGQAGPRKYALFEHGPRHVLIIEAFPSDSRRIGIFEGILASLRQR